VEIIKNMKLIIGCLLTLMLTNGYSQLRNPYEGTSWSQFSSIVSSLGIATLSTHILNRDLTGGQILSKSPLLWDQNFHSQYNQGYETASNTVPWLNVVFLVPSVRDERVFEDIMLYAEAVSWSAAVNMSVRAIKLWPRPLVHNDQSGPHKGEAYGSFYSGHASNSFAFATAFVHRQYHVHPHSKSNIWWASGAYLIASLTSSTRVLSGKHYPTDVIVGALMGSSISYLLMEYRSIDDQKKSQIGPVMMSPKFIQMSFSF
tara:strand:+ start:2033 stop:2809 length:777 start_codon:yes stop_codon:yes gene_type:complete